MNRRVLTVLLLAFVVAAGCALLVSRILGRRVAGTQKPATIRVVAAAADIKLGTILTAANLTTMQVVGPVPKGAILKPESAIGRGVISDLYQGEPILDARLAPQGSGGGLAATIRPGMRACAVKVDEVVGVAGFVTPGQRVDVLISGDPPGQAAATQGTRVKTLLQNIQVLSAGTDIQKDAEGKPQQVRVVNLLVSPEQAEALSLASNHTSIQLVLRNPLDTQTAEVSGTAMASLFGVPVPEKAPEHKAAPPQRLHEKAQTFSIEVLNGVQRSEQKFAPPGGGQ